MIPRISPTNIAIKMAEKANTKVFGRVSEIIFDTFLPWFTKEVLKYGYFKLTVNLLKDSISIPE